MFRKAIGYGVLLAFTLGCKPVRMGSSANWKSNEQSSEAKSKEAQANSSKYELIPSGFLFFIAPKENTAERCWYVSKNWGAADSKELDLKSGKDLQPLTAKAVTSRYVQIELNREETDDHNWRNGARWLLAGCTAASPLAMKSPVASVLLAICGVGGAYTERDTSEKISVSSKAEKVATSSADKPEGIAAAAEQLGEKSVVDVFVKALKGKAGDGKLDCKAALAESELKK